MRDNKDDEVYVKLLAGRNAREFKEQMEGEFRRPEKWEPFVFIVAREYAHANFLARFHHIPKRQWKYVWTLQDIGGGTGKVCFYYRWYELREADQIKDYVKTFKDRFEIIELEDKPDNKVNPFFSGKQK